MADLALPENVNNEDADFLVQKKLYVGINAAQFEVRKRFEEAELALADVKSKQTASDGAATGVTNRVGTLETEQGKLKTEQTNLANAQSSQNDTLNQVKAASETHAENSTIHVSEILRNHPTDATAHVPSGGTSGQVLSRSGANLLAWIDQLVTEGTASGLDVTPENVVAALGQYVASRWTLVGNPLGATRIRSAHFASDRFLLGGDNGNVASSWNASRWNVAQKLFDDPVEAFATGRLPDGTDVHVAMNAYSDFKISLDGKNWSPRLSLIFFYDENLNPLDKYATPDFTGICTGHGHFVMTTASGKIFRAKFEDILSEYHRITAHPTDRKCDVWKNQTSNSTVTRNMLRCAFGLERFVGVGKAGSMTYSSDGAFWQEITGSPFGGATINDVDFGDGKFLAVADSNKLAYSSNILHWTFVNGPFDADEDILCVKYGGGIWVIASNKGRIATTADFKNFTIRQSPFVVAARATAFGNTTFIIGDDVGNTAHSVSLADLFSSVTYSEFAQFVDRNDEWIKAKTKELADLKQYVLDELAKQLKIGTLTGQPSQLGGIVGETGDAADQGHRHDNATEVLQSQIDRATYRYSEAPPDDKIHLAGIPELDFDGKIHARNQTWQRAEASGDLLAPVDADGIIPARYIDRRVPRTVIYNALIAWSLDQWSLRSTPLFEDIGGNATITGAAASTTTVVLVGEQGRIAFGPHVRQLRRAASPFGQDKIVGVAFGTDPVDREYFIAVTKTHWSLSTNGEHWIEKIPFEHGDIESILFGGGKFLIPTSEGDIYRTEWTAELFDWKKQASSKTVTKGVRKIAFLEGRFVGVGANNLIVGSNDADHWHTEQSPCPSDTAWNDVFPGDGVFVTVGDKGRCATAEPGKTWVQRPLPTTADLLCGVFDKEHYVVAGTNGNCVTATRLTDWVSRKLPTSATICVAFWNRHACVLATDAGQLVISSTAAEALGLYDDDTGLGPSNDDPRPLDLLAFAGLLNTYSRADHVHPWSDEVLKSMIGAPEGVCPIDLASLIPETYMPWKRGEPNGVSSLDENGVVPDTEIRRGLPNGVAATDDDNILAKVHWPSYDDIIKEVVVIVQTGREFRQVFSPFHRGPQVSSILHDADCHHGKYVMVGEAGIGYATDPKIWKLSESQPFGTVPVIGCRFGEDDQNRIVGVAIDTEHRLAVSRNFGKTWTNPIDVGAKYDFSCLDYHDRTFTILCHGGEVLRILWIDGEPLVEEQADSPTITERLNALRGGNGLWLGVGNGGLLRSSTDASHFVPKDSGTTLDLFCATHGNGEFLIGAGGGNLFRTTTGDGLESAAKPFEGNADISSARFFGSLFYVTNRVGELAIGNGDQWNVQDCPIKGHPMRALSGDGNSFVVGDDFGNIAVSTQSISGIGGGNGRPVLLGENVDTDPDSGLSTVAAFDADGNLTDGWEDVLIVDEPPTDLAQLLEGISETIGDLNKLPSGATNIVDAVVPPIGDVRRSLVGPENYVALNNVAVYSKSEYAELYEELFTVCPDVLRDVDADFFSFKNIF